LHRLVHVASHQLEIGYRGFYLPPSHAARQHAQRVAQVDHVAEPGAKEIFGKRAYKYEQSLKQQRKKL
jgi:hypothetical protein